MESGLHAPWEGGNSLAAEGQSLHKPQRRGTEQEERLWPELPQVEEEEKFGFWLQEAEGE